ncbi:MAG: 50S ribosomal protein L25 [Chloroflexi bacterium]|nr:MAG: 50S ribosomal protein L25 [Chloroflexota bacterium]
MDKLSLKLEPRTITGKKVKNLRKTGLVPASICGKGVQSESFQLDAREFGLVYRRVGRSGLIDLQLPSGTQSAFVRQVQRHPVSQQFLHVDFRIVDLRTEIVADVPVVMVGENELVARGEGVLSIGHPTLHVRALPADLPQQIEVDISQITDFTTVIHVRDLNLGDKVQVLTAEDDNVVTVTPSRMDVEEAAITEQEQLGEPELAGDDATTAETDDDQTAS